MRRDDRIRLHHMLDATKAALGFASGRNQLELETDLQLQFALVRAIEIIGEAASKISPEMRELGSDIPWSSIVSMRNRLIHAYFDVDHDILWNTITEALPALEQQIEALLKSQARG
jgi:uncharacterized protein with HEPN domain